MRNAIILSASLAIVCAVAAGILGVAHRVTAEPRKKAAVEQRSQDLKLVLPNHDNVPLNDAMTVGANDQQVTFYRARKDERVVAVAGRGVTSRGYGGRLVVLVGLELNGDIRHVVVTEHSETPGLGTKATERKRQKTLGDVLRGADAEKKKAGIPPNKYLDQYGKYNVLEKTTFRVGEKEGALDAVSGATISSRAVADAVNQAAKAFREHRRTIVRMAPSEKAREQE